MKETIKNLKKVIRYGEKYKRMLAIQIFCSVLRIVTDIALPLLAAQQIVYFTSNIWEQLIFISLVILFLTFFNQLIITFTRMKIEVFRKGTQKNIQIKLGKEILKISQNDIDNNSSGMFIQRIVNDTDKMSDIFGTGTKYLQDVTIGIGTFIAIFIISPQVFLYYLIATIVLSILYVVKTKKQGNKDIAFRNQTEKVSSLTGELVRGTRDIKMLNAQNSFMAMLKEYIEKQNQRRFERGNIGIKYGLLIDTIKSIFEFGLILLLILLIKEGIIEVAIAIALYNYRTSIMTKLMEKISNLLEQVKNFNISCNRVFSIIGDKTFEKEKFGEYHLDKVDGNFEFRNVTFGYKENKKVLDNISFKINAGDMIGFVGKSGAGKTTIFNLLCKMYSINSGEILIENKNINELDEDSIRGNITIISQTPYIFNLSIRDNLKLVKEDLTEDEMIEACKMACLDEFIETLPEKYDTIVGEGGVILSGGQKQRLAIARAFVQKTKIILFDEATSSLDNETQAEIRQAIDNLKDEYTILIIAHRLSTIINCDKIMVLENGKIEDQGTHEELLNRNEEYQKLYQTEIVK